MLMLIIVFTVYYVFQIYFIKRCYLSTSMASLRFYIDYIYILQVNIPLANNPRKQPTYHDKN